MTIGQPEWYSVIRISGPRRNDNIGDWATLDEAQRQSLREFAYGTTCKVVDAWGRQHGYTDQSAPDGWHAEDPGPE